MDTVSKLHALRDFVVNLDPYSEHSAGMTPLDHIYRLLRLDFSRVEFRSPLPVDECEARLQELTDWHLSHRDKNADSPVVGEVSREDFFLYARPSSFNTFQTCLAGRMSPAGTGTRLECQYTIFLMAKIFLVLWFVVGGWIEIRTFYAAASALLLGSSRMPDGGSAWWGLAIPPAALLLGYGYVRFGRRRADDEKRMLIQFLARTLNARLILEGGPNA